MLREPDCEARLTVFLFPDHIDMADKEMVAIVFIFF